jgi:peptide deformylase
MVYIVQKDDPVLREVAQTIPVKEITSAKIKTILSDMKTALDSQEDGVAIAAPQIGQPLRIFRLSHVTAKQIEKKQDLKEPLPLVYINPIITKRSKDRKLMEEGCLSVRYLYGKIRRSSKVSIEAYDESGNKFSRGASGLLAQIYQHETDHLDGILFIDNAKDVVDLPPEQGE